MRSGWLPSRWTYELDQTKLARVVQAFGSARPHCAYLFANKRGNRMKVTYSFYQAVSG